MKIPSSQPIIPQQPESAYYGIGELALFRSYTRESYRAAFDSEPPPYDPERPVKSWFDSTVDTSRPAHLVSYRVIVRDGNQWNFQDLTIPASEAATVNLTGAFRYPEYIVAPTSATRGGGSINPVYLSLEADARALAAGFGVEQIGDEGVSTVFPVTYPPDEPRRLWYFMFRGRAVNVGALLYNRNKQGIGWPGQWDVSSGVPEWVPRPEGPTGEDDTRPSRPMPVRDLLPNEQLQAGLMGVGITRTDLASGIAAASGQFTEEDRATLHRIYELLTKTVPT